MPIARFIKLKHDTKKIPIMSLIKQKYFKKNRSIMIIIQNKKITIYLILP